MSIPESGGPSASAALDERLSIGAFAKRSWLSTKALRLYDGLGLLSPADVDQHNGYRWYRESQLETARLIAMLRRLDMPLERIGDVLAAGPGRAEVVAAYWDSVERRLAGQRELARHLHADLSSTKEIWTMYEILERDVPEQLVLTEQRHVTAGELPTFIYEAMSRLLKGVENSGGPYAAPFVVYHGEVNQDSDGPAEVCMPIDPARRAAVGTAARIEPAHREAYTRITKAQVEFPQIISAYTAVEQWARANNKQAGSPREVYFNDFGEAAPTDDVCDIAFPIV